MKKGVCNSAAYGTPYGWDRTDPEVPVIYSPVASLRHASVGDLGALRCLAVRYSCFCPLLQQHVRGLHCPLLRLACKSF